MNANTQPIVSVVMPVYNGEPYLKKAVESILKQTFNDFEFIIIDDGSTDNSWEILKAYAAQDSRVVLSRNPENIKLIKTLNKGLSLARGEHIARMDADDISLPERLARQVAYLQRHPEVGLLGTGYYRLYPDGQRELRQPPSTNTGLRWRLLFGTPMCHASVMFRRRLFETGEFNYHPFPHVEDYELFSRLLKYTCAASLPNPFYIVRMHQNSICATHSEEQFRTIISISAQQINTLLSEHSLTLPEIKILHRCYSAEALTQAEMAFCPVMFDLFKVFERQPNIDHVIVRHLRRWWIKRLLALNTRHLGWVWTSGLLQSILRHDPMALFMAGFVHLPQKFIRQLGQVPYKKGAAYLNGSN